MKKKKSIIGMAAVLSLSLLVFFTVPQEVSLAATADYPKKEITIIVCFGPGGARDLLARGVGNTLKKYLGVPVVIQNMPGAGGARGLISLFNSRPDGYTIGIGTIADIISQVLEKQDYDNKKFTYIGNVQHSGPVWFVKSDSPFRTLKDFKTYGKPVRHSAFTLTGNSPVAAMIVANREKFPLVLIGGYKSASEGILAVIRGEAEFSSCAASVALQFLRSGQLRPFLTLDQKREPNFLDTPTIAEAGHADLGALATDYWVMASPGVPKARSKILEDALMKTLKDPDFLKWTKNANVDLLPLSGAETAKKALKLFGLVEQYKGDIERYIKQ